MTPADLAKAAAMSFECKKDVMRQNQSGDWKITFTVQAVDVPRRLTEAMPGTRYQAVIVQIGDDELPVSEAAAPAATPRSVAVVTVSGDNPGGDHAPRVTDARPEPELNPPARAKRDWRDVNPAQQAGIRCGEAAFGTFLREEYAEEWRETAGVISDGEVTTENDRRADCLRLICAVSSRSQLNEGAYRVLWHQLNDQYEAWLKVGA